MTTYLLAAALIFAALLWLATPTGIRAHQIGETTVRMDTATPDAPNSLRPERTVVSPTHLPLNRRLSARRLARGFSSSEHGAPRA